MPEASSTLSIGSYNIHRCVGRDRRKDPARVADLLRSVDFDICGLQEVESSGDASHVSHQLHYLAEQTQCRAIAGPTMTNLKGDYGNGLLLRGEPSKIEHHNLSVDGYEPRGALDVTVKAKGGQLRVIVTHLGLGFNERRVQVQRLLDIVGTETRPTVVMGDFNEWLPWAVSRRRLVHRLGPIPMPRTFPSWRPLFAIDHIWVNPRHLLRSLSVVQHPLVRVASDHLPIIARVSATPS